ncbi:Ig-like domain-containing protein [Yersinia enterocolitica]|uniref:Ig-like domain-containing protein n=1 Tax=Yersinia enterocolitica TaxID=630 RepID=UPI003D0717CB
MSNQITLTGAPQFQSLGGQAADARITAVVIDDETGEPCSNVTVSFKTASQHVHFSKDSQRTDSEGRATVAVHFWQSESDYRQSAIQCVTITASVNSDYDFINLFFYSDELRPAYITNLAEGNVLTGESIASGIQVIISLSPDSDPGDIYRLFWGKETVERAYDGSNFPWIVNISEIFPYSSIFSEGDYPVYYKIINSAENSVYSKPVIVKVVINHATIPCLLPPILPEEIHGFIDFNAIKNGIKVIIPRDDRVEHINDKFDLFMSIKTLYGKPIRNLIIKQGYVTGRHTEAKVDYKDLEGFRNAYCDFYYEIYSESDNSKLKSTAAKFIIDTVKPRGS